MKVSKFIAVLFSWNYKVWNLHGSTAGNAPIYAVGYLILTELRDKRNWRKARWGKCVLVVTTALLAVEDFLFPFFFPKLFQISLQCFLVEITKFGIAMNCSYRNIAIAIFVISTGKHCKEFRCFHIGKIVLFSNFTEEFSEKKWKKNFTIITRTDRLWTSL